MYDVALQFSEKSKKKSTVLAELGLRKKEYILATIHRAENTDRREYLTNIFQALGKMSEEQKVVVPLHPRTRKMLVTYGLAEQFGGIKFIEPVGFLDMIALEISAKMIATDSGGVQKEAYFHRIPCVTLRGETEWVETVEAKWNMLANVESVERICDVLRESLAFSGQRFEIDDYGDGTAARKIVQSLSEFLAA